MTANETTVKKRPWQAIILIVYSALVLLLSAILFISITYFVITSGYFEAFIFFPALGQFLVAGVMIYCLFRARKAGFVLLLITIVRAVLPSAVNLLSMAVAADGIAPAAILARLISLAFYVFLLCCLLSKANRGWCFQLYIRLEDGDNFDVSGEAAERFSDLSNRLRADMGASGELSVESRSAPPDGANGDGYELLYAGGGELHADAEPYGREEHVDSVRAFGSGESGGLRDDDSGGELYGEYACDEEDGYLEDAAWDAADQQVPPEDRDAWDEFCAGRRMESVELAVEMESERLGSLDPLELLRDCPIRGFLKAEPKLRSMVEKTGKQALYDLRGYEKAPRSGIAGGDCDIRHNQMICRFEITENVWPIPNKVRLELYINP